MKFLISIPLVCITLATSGKADPLELVGGALNEVLHPAAQISGTTIVGAMILAHPFSDQLNLSAELPADWAGGQTCVTLISADGLYEAANTYEIAQDWPGGRVNIDYPSAYPDKLLPLKPEELAMLGRPGSCDTPVADEVIPLGWRQSGQAEGDVVRLFINAFHADEVYLFVGEDPLAPAIPCRAPDTLTTTAFDFVCDISLQGSDDVVDIELNRVSSGQIAPPLYFSMRLSAS